MNLYGRPCGFYWQRLEGEAFTISGTKSRLMIYFYPDLSSAIYGHIDENDRMTYGKFAQIYEFDQTNSSQGIPVPKVILHDFPESYKYDLSTSIKISSNPLLRDPYEQQTSYIDYSRVHQDAGEGLFVKRYLEKGKLIAIFNGIRKRYVNGIVPQSSAYNIGLSRNMDLDITDSLASASRYCATIAHKACHSFTPNASFQILEHPR